VLNAVGLVFELPIFILALVRLGVLSTTTLRKNRRLGYFIVAVIAVLLPGVDPVTTTFEMVPLMVLYEGSIWLSVLMERRAGRMEAASLSEP
jgi:sec-independent protein translocase protein TatC